MTRLVQAELLKLWTTRTARVLLTPAAAPWSPWCWSWLAAAAVAGRLVGRRDLS
jgi:hypothetical protein